MYKKRLLLFSAVLSVCSFGWSPAAAQTNPLAIPPTLEGPTYDLVMRDTSHVFFDGIQTATAGFNGSFLGPTLIWNKGDDIQINVTNNLGEPTTVHWHGAHVSAENDGGPHSVIPDGTTWSPAFEVMNRASTIWYHPHLHMFTNMHVYQGLAGMIIVRDDEEAALDLPREYGVDDFPIVLQDRKFDVDGQLVFQPMGKGLVGDTYVINGTIDPILDAPGQVVRLRIVNGSSGRVYNVGMGDNRAMQQIASDGGLLEAPVALTRIRLSPGERAEVLLDLASDIGDTLRVVNYASELTNGERGGTFAASTPLDGVDSTLFFVGVSDALPGAVTSIPSNLTTITPLLEADAVKTRPMIFNNNELGQPFGINGIGLDLEVVNEVVNLNDTEIWEVGNETGDPHPFHIHMVTFQILDRDGVAPPENERGWKDVVFVYPSEVVRLITKFETFADPTGEFMYHCHILDHEDRGMMGQFVVVDNSTDATEDTRPRTGELLVRNYPNPFTDRTTIAYSMPSRSELKIEVFDVLGQRVKMVFDGVREQGDYETIWKTGDAAGGVYFVRLTTPSQVVSHRVVLAGGE